MTDQGDDARAQALDSMRGLLNGELLNEGHEPTSTLVVTGPPCSGKTAFALAALLEGIEVFGVEDAVMVVSGRQAAADMSRKVIEARGVVDESRPVGTLSALAFRLLSEDHRARHLPAPKLLNGAEQEALLRKVLAEHVSHVLKGDPCETCGLLRSYYGGLPSWIAMLTGRDVGFAADRQEDRHDLPSGTEARPDVRPDAQSGVRTTLPGGQAQDDLASLAESIRADFVAQLRDTIARVNELGLAFDDEDDVVQALSFTALPDQERVSLELQWRLSFRLWREYAEHIEAAYSDEARLDSSRLLVEAADAVRRAMPGGAERTTVEGLHIPRLLVMDDWQDVTLAGMSLLQALSAMQCRLLLVGNSDEAVQIFRGSYPEYLDVRVTTSVPGADAPLVGEHIDNRNQQTGESPLLTNAAVLGRLDAKRVVLPARPLLSLSTEMPPEGPRKAGSYLDVVAARVSLGIPSEEEESLGMPRRPGKLPQWEGTLPIRPLGAASTLPKDGSIEQHLFHTQEEELAHVVWQIKHESLSNGRNWNDMAVIAHDNATIESYGRRLREEGVPVRFSSVTKPLKDEPTVQGLFALIELAERRRDPAKLDAESSTQAMPDAEAQAQWIRARVRAVLSSPLITTNSSDASGERPVRLERLDMLMDSCVALAKLDDPERELPASSPDVQRPELSNAEVLSHAWESLRDGIDERKRQSFARNGIIVDDSLTTDAHAGVDAPRAMDRSALYALLALSDGDVQNRLLTMMAAIASNTNHDPDVEALVRLSEILSTIDAGLATLDVLEPQYVLWLAWDSCAVASPWQRESLAATHRGELANDRLDAVMRLFQFASGSQSFDDADAFISQVRGMQIEADSLAHIGPVEQAVTLTTPAGAAAEARRWPLVWLPALQEGVWPNVTQRDTLFSTEDLADLVMRFNDASSDFAFSSTGRRLRSTLHAEKKNLLMAVTRASQRVVWSAVWNDDMVPSDFIFGYLPELCPRVKDPMEARFTTVGALDGEDSAFGGLELSPRGLITLARGVLLRESSRRLSAHAGAGATDFTGDEDRHGSGVEDAIRTLRLLHGLGYESADPDAWAFVGGVADEDRAATAAAAVGESVGEAEVGESVGDAAGTAAVKSVDAPVGGSIEPSASVTLSPSAVDSIWACPLEWVVGRQLSGPQPGSIYMSFGSVVHHVAQLASEQGLDDADAIQGEVRRKGQQAVIDSTTDAMMDLYRQCSGELSSPPDYKQSYDLLRRDANARTIMGNIASYFVRSVQKEYAQSGSKPIDVGGLERVECELPFTAQMTIADVLPLWNASFGDVCPLDASECFAVMSALVGGFPAALDEHVSVRLSGRIDRLEHRLLGERPVTRLVDYKTGSKAHPRKEVFSDLQLVCYQLGQYFAASDDQTPTISQAVLFDVAVAQAPATSGTEEASYQPALLRGDGFNTVFAPRSGSPKIDKLYVPEGLPTGLSEKTPNWVSDETWNFVRQQSGQQGIWAMTMISRVFYAAGVKLSVGGDLARFDAERCHNGGADGCPAWKVLHGNVMEDEG